MAKLIDNVTGNEPANAVEKPSLTRRRFLEVTTLGSAGFLIGCGESGSETGVEVAANKTVDSAIQTAGQPTGASELNHFVRIGSDNTVTVICKHLDKGQGVTTGLPTIVAEELEADWSQMRAELAPADASKYAHTAWGVQGTGGSSSIANSWTQMREAAASARDMLVRAAANEWGVDPAQINVERGVLKHDGKQASFGQLAVAAARLEPPTEVSLKSPQDFKLIGQKLPRLDSPAKTDGTAQYTIDVQRPGMLMALVAHPPRFGATVSRVDDSKARAIKGVTDVVQIPSGVAVLADSYWSALRGRDALAIEWDFSAAENRSSEALAEEFRPLAATPGVVARDDGATEAAIAKADKVVEASFDFPYLAHATMEPLNCVVELRADECEIWTGAQLHTFDQANGAAAAGLEPSQIKINTQFAGGSFGRRGVPTSDYIVEAILIAKAIDGRAPVKLQWAREDDMRGGYYRPISHHVLRGGINDQGDITAWSHRLVTQSVMKGTPFEASMKDGIDGTAVEGARGLAYAIDNVRVEQHLADVGVPVLWWRSVGHTHNGYVTEVFIDQLAAAAKKDPVALRRKLLADKPRHLAVLNLAADKAAWGSRLPPGHARGVAVHESFNTLVAEIAEISVAADGQFKVERVVCAVECGIAVNPDVVKAQMEGGIGYGLSALLREAVTLVDGEVQQTNFDRYRPLRINEMPQIEVYIVPSNNPPSGVGEPGVPPIAPAVANALFAATGKLLTRLPFEVSSTG